MEVVIKLVKVPKVSRFSKCATCERIRAVIQEAKSNWLPTDALQEEKYSHIPFVIRERREYLQKAEDALIEPSKILSINIDGAYQSTFAITCFVTSKKEQRGHYMAAHLIGVLRHGIPNRL